MSNEETLKAGIEAAKSGDLVRAAALFAEVVRVDPSSEQGWLCLGMSLSAPDRREYCFRRVLALNPNNNQAISQLERLAGSAKTPPAPVPPPQRDIPKEPAYLPPAQPVYTSRPLRYTFPEDETPEESKPAIVEPVTAPFYMEQVAVVPEEEVPSPPVVKAATKAVPKKKKSNTMLFLGLGVAATLIVGGAIIAFLYLSGGMNELLNGNFAPLAAPVPLNTLPSPRTSASPTALSVLTELPPTALPTPKPFVSYTPVLKKADCPFDVPAGANVSCSYVIVPEDRTGDSYDPPGGRRLSQHQFASRAGPGGIPARRPGGRGG